MFLKKSKSLEVISFIIVHCCLSHSLFAIPIGGIKNTQKEDYRNLLYTLSNIQAELQTLREKLQNQEDILEALKKDIDITKKKNGEETKGKQGVMDQKLSTQDIAMKGFAEDLRCLKHHINQSTENMQQSETRLKELEKSTHTHEESIEHLRSALSTLLEGLKGQGSEKKASYTHYEVKSGDSLGLIAQRAKISVKHLKELNELKSNTIYQGQKLRLPEKS